MLQVLQSILLNTMQQFSTSIEATMALGQKIGESLKNRAVIELIGDVGAGKTTFVKGLGKGLGITETIVSPTFTIFQSYQAKNGRHLYHYDFYRLAEPGLMKYELAGALSDASGLTIIEWAESVQDVLPKKHITVRLTPISETERSIEIKGLTQ